MDENRLMYTFTEAAKMLGVSRPTIYKLIKAGKLRGIKLFPGRSGACRILREDIVALIEKCKEASNG